MSDQPQHITALQQANANRLARAALRARLNHDKRRPAGRQAAMNAAASEIDPPPEELRTMPIGRYLRWVCSPRIARAIMHAADIHDELRPLGKLTDRQLGIVREELRAPLHGREAAA